MVRCEKCFESYDDRIAAGVCPHCGYYTGEPQADPRYLPIGFVLHDRYVIGGVIGVGGFGISIRRGIGSTAYVRPSKSIFSRAL